MRRRQLVAAARTALSRDGVASTSLRAAGQESLARWQYERYGAVVAAWCRQAAQNAGESCAVSFARLGRVVVASLDGLVLQHVCDLDETRSREDLAAVTEMIVSLAGVRRNAPAGESGTG
ncbi:hypothetical protein GCM10010222_75920 [Streptomyces tanashiensis]|uniref:hypothetical protein n=1 Tax=Streptomyces tanashiensis TaxID=67367 RepID=UPI001679B673|nr:hypothetical protein [Streptomyces tanashiensis]GGT22840.1 hypothetical protein GCM10010222_75920 [Streptomyces tanashiensis]